MFACGIGTGTWYSLSAMCRADTCLCGTRRSSSGFLHPGAVRKLIEILRQHPQHQFIITTHSPTAVTAAGPETLLLLRLREAETTIEQLNVSQAENLQVFLAEIGARLSDVFGADYILWVEGRTEEECFPKIVHRWGRPVLGTAIVGV